MKTNTIATLLHLGVLAFGLAACSKSEAPPPRVSDGTQSPKGQQPQKPTLSPLHQEAIAIAENTLSDKLAKDGDSWFTLYQSRLQNRGNFNSKMIELKGITLQVTPLPLSEADNLNRVQWRGQVTVFNRNHRSYDLDDSQKLKWSDWESETSHHYSLDSLNYELIKKNDQWTNNARTKETGWPYSEADPGIFFKLTKPSEDQIKNLGDEALAAAERQRVDAAIAAARQAEKEAKEREEAAKKREELALTARGTATPLGQVDCVDASGLRTYRFVVTTVGVTRELLMVRTIDQRFKPTAWAKPVDEQREVVWFDELTEKPGYWQGHRSTLDREITLKNNRLEFEWYCAGDQEKRTSADYLDKTFKLLQTAIDSWKSKYPDLARW